MAWSDPRTSDISIIGQLVAGDSTKEWADPAFGLTIASRTGTQNHQDMATDQWDGAIVTWEDTRVGGISDIYVQHVMWDATQGIDAVASHPVHGIRGPWPNPAGRSVRLAMHLDHPASAEANILDITGRRVAVILRRKELPAGDWSPTWDLRDEHGVDVGAGIYFVEVRIGEAVETRRLAVLR